MSWRMNWDICCWGQTRILGKELCVPIGMATSYAAPVWELSYLRQSRREPLEKNYLVNPFKLVTGVAETRTWPEDRKVVPGLRTAASSKAARNSEVYVGSFLVVRLTFKLLFLDDCISLCRPGRY